MVFRGRTVALFVGLSIIISSVGTSFFMGAKPFLEREEFLAEQPLKMADGNFGLYSEKLKKTYSLIKGNYIHQVSDQKLLDGAIQGMVQALGDPYSTYMDPQTASQFKQGLESSFIGIGAEVTIKNRRLTVVSPFKDSPSERAGIRSGDQIVKVNGETLDGLGISEAVSKIRGPVGTKAVLEIVRPGVHSVLKITVLREEIPLKTVASRLDSDKIGVIAITQFSEGTADDFSKELKKLEASGMKGLIVDLRGNPGGLLPSVLKVCDQLIANKTVLMTRDKQGKGLKYVSSLKKAKPYPIAALIDKGSASAAEILAAALQEAGGYPLVGERSFGKGTVQSAEDFSDGSNIKLTMAKWLTPKGNWIDQHGGTKGIKPNFEVNAPIYLQAVPPQGEQVLRRNQNSVEVKHLQMVLDALGFIPGRTDGYFDQRTEMAIRAFQRTHRLPMTGVFDRTMASLLHKDFARLLSDPKNDVPLQVAKQNIKKKW